VFIRATPTSAWRILWTPSHPVCVRAEITTLLVSKNEAFTFTLQIHSMNCMTCNWFWLMNGPSAYWVRFIYCLFAHLIFYLRWDWHDFDWILHCEVCTQDFDWTLFWLVSINYSVRNSNPAPHIFRACQPTNTSTYERKKILLWSRTFISNDFSILLIFNETQIIASAGLLCGWSSSWAITFEKKIVFIVN
jgi:hypothetical protein